MTARLRVRLTPRGGADRIDTVEFSADGGPLVRARVRAAPVDGEANAALERLLASALDLPKTAVSVARGATGRMKAVQITGLEQDACLARLTRAAAENG